MLLLFNPLSDFFVLAGVPKWFFVKFMLLSDVIPRIFFPLPSQIPDCFLSSTHLFSVVIFLVLAVVPGWIFVKFMQIGDVISGIYLYIFLYASVGNSCLPVLCDCLLPWGSSVGECLLLGGCLIELALGDAYI